MTKKHILHVEGQSQEVAPHFKQALGFSTTLGRASSEPPGVFSSNHFLNSSNSFWDSGFGSTSSEFSPSEPTESPKEEALEPFDLDGRHDAR